MGWLQDWSSDFSINHISKFIKDPHKEIVDYGTKGMQRTIGPIASEFIPYVGPYVSAAERVWLASETNNPNSHNYKAPDSSPAAEAGQGVATIGLGNLVSGGSGAGSFSLGGSSSSGTSSSSSGTSALGGLGSIGSLFGGSSSSGAASSQNSLWSLINSLLDTKNGPGT